jgi:hypothetical protein
MYPPSTEQMALLERTTRRARADDHRTYGEEVALMLSLVIVSVLGLTLVSLLVVQFLDILPSGVSVTVMLSLLVFGIVVGRAMFERILAVPTIYRGLTPIVRHHH